jgi:hypothetical protein
VGGIADREYRGNRIDIGGHRFFSKTDSVVDWWLGVLPLQRGAALDDGTTSVAQGPDPDQVDEVMLSRSRISRIYFCERFFDYPVSLGAATIRNLGLARTARIGVSYLAARLRPIKPEKNLEDFMVNRFGRELYQLFFEDYTEKVWGVPCTAIGPEWGAQRIKGTYRLGAAARGHVDTACGPLGTPEGDGVFVDRSVPVSEVRSGAVVECVAKQVEARGAQCYSARSRRCPGRKWRVSRVRSSTVKAGRESVVTVARLVEHAACRLGAPSKAMSPTMTCAASRRGCPTGIS